MSYKLNPFTGKLDNTGSTSGGVTSIDDLSDVDNSTTPPTDGQALVWDAAAGEYKPGTISTSGGSGGGTTDALASYVTLLVDGDTGITDSSTSARAITVSGSSASSSTYSKAGGGSVHKTANSYLSIPNDPDIKQWHNRPGGYCLDYWIYNPGTNWTGFSSPSSTNTSVVIGDLNPTGGANYWGFGPNDSGVPCFYWYPGGASGTAIVGTTTLSLNTWHHLAVSIDTGNSTMRLFVDGVQEATSTSYAGTYSGSPLIIGQLNNVSPEFYIDHLRITTGNPRFTSNFNPADELPSTGGTSGTNLPTATTDGRALIVENGQWVEGPVIGGVNYLANDPDFSSVSLLLHADGTNASTTFTDDSPNSFTVTANGNAQISTAQSKFGGASAVFDGTGDYLSVPADADLALGTDDFTIECWYRPTSKARQFPRIFQLGLNTWSTSDNLALLDRHDSANTKFSVLIYNLGVNNFILQSTTVVQNNVWYHLALTRSGSTFRLFVDGVEEASYTNAGAVSTSATVGAYVGGNSATDGSLDGYVDELRVTKGVARYTADFTPASSAFPGASDTIVIPYSIDNLDDVDISTTAPTNGQALLWDNADSKFKPGTVSSGSSLPTANDGETIVRQNGQWIAGPVVGGYDYNLGDSITSVYTPPTGFSGWSAEFSTADTVNSPSSEITLSNNNRTATANTQATWKNAISTSSKSTGKWYWEIKVLNSNSQGNEFTGIFTNINAPYAGHSTSGGMSFRSNASTHYNNSGASKDFTSYSSYTVNDILMFAIDLDNKKLWYGKNGTWDNSGDPAAGTGQMYSNWTGTPSFYFAHSLHENGDSVELVGYLVPGTTYQAPAIAKRKTSSVTTSSIATNASADVTLPLTGKAGQFISVTVDYPAWVVFYTDAAARTADASRAQTTDALPGSGVLLEVATSTAGETVVVTPSSGYFNNESTPVSELSIKVVNLDSVARAITVDAKVIPLEV